MTLNAGMMTSDKSNWRTPVDVIIDPIRLWLGTICLDPCADSDPVNHFAVVNLAGTDAEHPNNVDGLNTWYAHGGLAFVNPPYGRRLGEWMKCCAQHHCNGHEVVALVPARTDTRWFQSCWESDAICFIRGRLTFVGADNCAPFPSALVYWGDRVGRFERAFTHLGRVIST